MDILINNILTAIQNKLPSPKTPGNTTSSAYAYSNYAYSKKLKKSPAFRDLKSLGEPMIPIGLKLGERTLNLRPRPKNTTRRPSFSQKN